MKQGARSVPKDVERVGEPYGLVTHGLALTASGLGTGWERPLSPGTLAPTSPLPPACRLAKLALCSASYQ